MASQEKTTLLRSPSDSWAILEVCALPVIPKRPTWDRILSTPPAFGNSLICRSAWLPASSCRVACAKAVEQIRPEVEGRISSHIWSCKNRCGLRRRQNSKSHMQLQEATTNNRFIHLGPVQPSQVQCSSPLGEGRQNVLSM